MSVPEKMDSIQKMLIIGGAFLIVSKSTLPFSYLIVHVIYWFIVYLKIFPLYEVVAIYGKGLLNSSICGFVQERIFIVPHCLGHRTSVFAISFKGNALLSLLLWQQKGTENLFLLGSSRCNKVLIVTAVAVHKVRFIHMNITHPSHPTLSPKCSCTREHISSADQKFFIQLLSKSGSLLFRSTFFVRSNAFEILI